MKKSILAIFIATIFATTTFTQTPLDRVFDSYLSEITGVNEDTSNVSFAFDFPTASTWERDFSLGWAEIDRQIRLNLEQISSMNLSPDAKEKKVLSQRSSANGQYKVLVEKVNAALLKRAQIIYQQALNNLEQLKLSNFQKKTELAELKAAFEKSKSEIEAKKQEFLAPFNQTLVVEEKKTTGTIIFDSSVSPEKTN